MGYMSLGPGFIGSRVHRVPGSMCLQLLCNLFCNFLPTFFWQPFCKKICYLFCNLFQLLCNFLLPKKLLKVIKKSCKKSCKKVALKVTNKFQTGAKKVATNLQKKLQKKLHTSCKHIEPGTQWTRDTKTCFRMRTLVYLLLCQRPCSDRCCCWVHAVGSPPRPQCRIIVR